MSEPQPRLLVLAAGLGVRFGGQKQTAPVGPAGELLMDYTVHDAADAGVETLVVVLRPEQEAEFHAQRGKRYARRMNVIYVHQAIDDVPPGSTVPGGRVQPWGTGHAVWAARRALPTPFVVANADDFYGRDSILSAVTFLREPAPPGRAPCAMVTYALGDTLSPRGPVARGICEVGADGLLRRIEEVTGLSGLGSVVVAASDHDADASQTQPLRRFHGREPVSMNLWALRPEVLPALERGFAAFLADRGSERGAEYYLPAAIQAGIDAGALTVRVLQARELWFGLTHPDDVAPAAARLRELVELGIYPRSLRGPSQ